MACPGTYLGGCCDPPDSPCPNQFILVGEPLTLESDGSLPLPEDRVAAWPTGLDGFIHVRARLEGGPFHPRLNSNLCGPLIGPTTEDLAAAELAHMRFSFQFKLGGQWFTHRNYGAGTGVGATDFGMLCIRCPGAGDRAGSYYVTVNRALLASDAEELRILHGLNYGDARYTLILTRMEFLPP